MTYSSTIPVIFSFNLLYTQQKVSPTILMQPDQGSQEIFGSWILVQDFFLMLGANELNDYIENITGFQGSSSFFFVAMLLISIIFSSVQQICNAVTISRLLNATLVIPKFLYSNVWLDKRYSLSFLITTVLFLVFQISCFDNWILCSP